MANTSVIYTHINTELKKDVEKYSRTTWNFSIQCNSNALHSNSFNKKPTVKITTPPIKPTSIGSMSKDEFDNEIMKGLHSLTSDKTYTIDEVNSEFAREFGI